MKYQVIYTKQKKKAISKQVAVFFNLEDASSWEKHVQSQGYSQTEIVPIFS